MEEEMAQQIDHELCGEIIDRVRAADEPLTWRQGPYSDRALKATLGLPRHQSVICANVNYLVSTGQLRQVDTGLKGSVILGEQLRSYPVMQLLPA